MKLIKLTQGKFAKVDDEDFEYLNKFKWCISKKVGGTNYYAARSVKGKTIRMHRVIMATAKGMETDHIDGDGLNNQKNNLRFATSAQNKANRKSSKNSTSKYLGVSLYKCKIKNKTYTYWIMKIRKDKTTKYCKYFKTEREAAIAYNEKAKEVHGEFANLNII